MFSRCKVDDYAMTSASFFLFYFIAMRSVLENNIRCDTERISLAVPSLCVLIACIKDETCYFIIHFWCSIPDRLLTFD